MAEFAPLRTGQLVIRQRAPWHQRVVVVVLIIGIVMLMYGLFEWGRQSAGYDVMKVTREREAAQAQIKALKQENALLHSQNAATDVARHVDSQAYGEVEKSLNELQNQVLRQQEIIASYRGILTPEPGPEGVKIQSLEILPRPGTGHFLLQLVLIQSIRQEAVVTGTAAIRIAGTRNGKAMSIGPLPFSFRYFQNLEEEIALPEGFAPTSVDVELRSGRQGTTRQTFPWQVQAVAG